MEAHLLHDLVPVGATQRGDAPALVHGGESLDYAALQQRVATFAAGLLALGHGLEPFADDEGLAAKLKKCEGRLSELAGDLSDRVAIVPEMLAAPEKQLALAVHTLRLDQMNFVVEAADAACTEVTFVETTTSEELSRVLVPVQIFRAELAPARDALADAEKYL